MTLHFEMFLADNVKFGSLNELLEFVNHICKEEPEWKYNDDVILDHIPSVEECFAKLVLDCGYRWIPDESELDIIWKVVNNLTIRQRARVYYKNNLYMFLENKNIIGLVKHILKTLKTPFYTSSKVPPEVANDLNDLRSLMMEYVYYKYMVIDRIDRCDHMIKSVTMVSDTDSTIISTDAWYQYIGNTIQGEDLAIAKYCADPIMFDKKDEDGNWTVADWREPITFLEKDLDYDFLNDEIVDKGFKFKRPEDEEEFKTNNPEVLTPNDNVRYSIISILSYVLDTTVNDYMTRMCQNQYSVKEPYHTPKECKIYAKTEFLFKRLTMVPHAKKNYASIQEIQEGNMVPEDEQLDIKGIEALHKSSKPLSTRKALKKILLEDILKAPAIDQLKFIKDIAILEKTIVNSIRDGNKEYFKPATIKAANSYDDPMKIQGIKGSVAWNMIKDESDPGINLDERNAVNIVKVEINMANVENIKNIYPNIYNNIVAALSTDTFKKFVKDPKTGRKDKLVSNSIEAVSLPLDTNLPEWLSEFVDYNSIIADNLNGFPYESIGIHRMLRNSVNQTNIVSL